MIIIIVPGPNTCTELLLTQVIRLCQDFDWWIRSYEGGKEVSEQGGHENKPRNKNDDAV